MTPPEEKLFRYSFMGHKIRIAVPDVSPFDVPDH